MPKFFHYVSHHCNSKVDNRVSDRIQKLNVNEKQLLLTF